MTRMQHQPQATRPSQPESVVLPSNSGRGDKKHEQKNDFLSMGNFVGPNILLFIVALLVAAVVWLIYTTNPAAESKLVDSAKMQAVFLNTGQVYFGNIQALNKEYFVLSNIFYLQTSGQSGSSSSSANNQISLVKLGCELHMPYDRMVINATQVTFWENLQSNGQVAKAVQQWDKQNPSGQKCTDQSQAPNSQSNVQNQSKSTNTNTTTTNSSTNKP